MIEHEHILKEIRKRCLVLANSAHDGNLQSVFSSLEILWWLYDSVLDIDKIVNQDYSRDYFLCSKGQATLGLLMVLSQKGLIPLDELDSYGKFDSRISMQVDRTKFDFGIEISAGSLGHGLPMAVGVAMAKKMQNLSGDVFVMIGDGELHEGTNWEAIEVLGSRVLSNVWVIVDDNESHRYIHEPHGIANRIKSFGFEAAECNGHEIGGLQEVYKRLSKVDKPKLIIAKTRRGYGSKTLMTDRSWFHKAPNDDELDRLLLEVDHFNPEEALFYELH